MPHKPRGRNEFIMNPIVLRPLEPERIRQAFPLVQTVLPRTSLQRWTEFARGQMPERRIASDRGVMAAENQSGYIVGLFTHHIRDELAVGSTLSVGNLLIADFPGREQATGYFIDSMEVMAHLRGCHAIAVDLDIAFADGGASCVWALPVFERCGFAALSTSQCRKLLPTRRYGLVASDALSQR